MLTRNTKKTLMIKTYLKNLLYLKKIIFYKKLKNIH